MAFALIINSVLSVQPANNNSTSDFYFGACKTNPRNPRNEENRVEGLLTKVESPLLAHKRCTKTAQLTRYEHAPKRSHKDVVMLLNRNDSTRFKKAPLSRTAWLPLVRYKLDAR